MLLHPTLLATLLAIGPLVAFAQASAPPAPEPRASGASTPASAAPTGPRMRSPSETGNRAAAPGDLRPERPVTPQISVPFGKKPLPSTKADERATQRGKPAAGSVDDAAARCESQTDAQVRAACRARLAREAKGKLPN